ncbi:MAG: prepilin-type N-terminal cleavage/methylation domain-containing protein [Bryobacteraceae bacterium]
MPISSAGKRSKAAPGLPAAERGVTLLELLVVTAIVGLIVGLSFPSISAGLESIRLSSATNSIVSFLDGALNRAERREEAIEVVIWAKENRLAMYSSAPGFERHLQLPEGVTIEAVLPEAPQMEEGPRSFLLIPGGVPPRIGVQLRNRRGSHRIVRVDPITGVPQVEELGAQ